MCPSGSPPPPEFYGFEIHTFGVYSSICAGQGSCWYSSTSHLHANQILKKFTHENKIIEMLSGLPKVSAAMPFRRSRSWRASSWTRPGMGTPATPSNASPTRSRWAPTSPSTHTEASMPIQTRCGPQLLRRRQPGSSLSRQPAMVLMLEAENDEDQDFDNPAKAVSSATFNGTLGKGLCINLGSITIFLMPHFKWSNPCQ